VGLGCAALVAGCLLSRFALFCLCEVGQSSPGFNRKNFVLGGEWLKATGVFVFLSTCLGALSHVGAGFGLPVARLLRGLRVTCAVCRTRVLRRYRWRLRPREREEVALGGASAPFHC